MILDLWIYHGRPDDAFVLLSNRRQKDGWARAYAAVGANTLPALQRHYDVELGALRTRTTRAQARKSRTLRLPCRAKNATIFSCIHSEVRQCAQS